MPARLWWLKRLTLLCVVLAVTLVAVRLWWGWEAERRLRAALEPLVAAGWPVRGRDLDPAPVPDDANAAIYLKQAIAAVDPDNDSPASTSSTAPYYSDEWGMLAEKSVTGSARAFAYARRARAFDRFDWGTRMKRPALATQLPHLNQCRHLANTIGDAALHAHAHGDDAAAIEAVRDVRHLARSVGEGPMIICHLVEVGVEALAMSRLQRIAWGLNVGPEGQDTAGLTATAATPGPLPAPRARTPQRPASRAQVRALIGELLDERDVEASLRRAVAGERAVQLDLAEWMGEPPRVLRPMFQLDAVRMVEMDDALARAAAQPSAPQAKALLAATAVKGPPAPPAPPGGTIPAKREVVDYPRLLSSSLLGGGLTNGRFFEISMRSRAERRMSAVSLAAQLYRADTGVWPPTLDALVPKYLPHVPRDPMAADGRPLKYLLVKGGLPGGGDRPVVYSVGNNGVDDTPDASALPGAPWSSWHSAREEYRDIAQWPGMPPPAPPPAPATAPGATQPAANDVPLNP